MGTLTAVQLCRLLCNNLQFTAYFYTFLLEPTFTCLTVWTVEAFLLDGAGQPLLPFPCHRFTTLPFLDHFWWTLRSADWEHSTKVLEMLWLNSLSHGLFFVHFSCFYSNFKDKMFPCNIPSLKQQIQFLRNSLDYSLHLSVVVMLCWINVQNYSSNFTFFFWPARLSSSCKVVQGNTSHVFRSLPDNCQRCFLFVRPLQCDPWIVQT